MHRQSYLQLGHHRSSMCRIRNVVDVYVAVLSTHNNILRLCDVHFGTESGTDFASSLREQDAADQFQFASLCMNMKLSLLTALHLRRNSLPY